MKVLHVLNTSSFSGAENVVCQIISMFDDSNYEMAYCSFDGDIRNALSERNIKFLPVVRMNISEIKRIIGVYKPDIIHAHDMKTGFVVACACGKTPFISHIHNNAFDSRGLSLKSIAYFFAAAKAKSIIWVSQSSFDGYLFHSVFKKKSTILYNVIRQNELFDRMKQDPNDYDYDVVYVGRLTYEKDPFRLLEIIKKASLKKNDIKVAIVGSGEMETDTRKLCTELGLDNNVTFVGYRNNPLKILKDSGVLIMSSRWEGTPMVALEAIALGVPIISTPTDGMKDLVVDGVNGYLANDNDIFAEEIIRIITDSELRKKMSDNQLKRSSEVNDVEEYKCKLIELYNL